MRGSTHAMPRILVVLFFAFLTLSAQGERRTLDLIQWQDSGGLPLDAATVELAKGYLSSIPKSKWYDSQSAFYESVLTVGKFDTLVVPFQVKGFAIDAIGRSLMARYLVALLEEATSARIPNPTLVERALGENARVYERGTVYRMANALNVRTVIWGYVGHDNNHNLSFSLEVQQGQAGKLGAATPKTTYEWNKLKFSDENLPADVFYAERQTIMRKLGIAYKPRSGATKQSPLLQLPVPESIKEITGKTDDSPLVAAYRLQLLGSLHPLEGSRERERLFERSLVALTNVPETTPDYRLLKARALFALHRRPAALALLAKPHGPEETALLERLNGNLPQSRQATNRVAPGLRRLLAEIELVDLSHSYGANIADESYTAIANPASGLAFYVSRRLDQLRPWKVQRNHEVKGKLDEAFPIPGYTVESIAQSKVILGGVIDETDYDLAPFKHIQKLLSEKRSAWCCKTGSWRPGVWDQLDLLGAIAEANLIKVVERQLNWQQLPSAALETLDRYDLVYEGHPAFVVRRASAYRQLSEELSGREKENLLVRYLENARYSYYWSGGQTKNSLSAFAYLDSVRIPHISKLHGAPSVKEVALMGIYYEADFPRRAYWLLARGPEGLRRELPVYAQALKYADKDFNKLGELHFYLSAEDPKAAEKLFQENERRFIGNPQRLSFIVHRKEKEGDTDGLKRIYRELIEEKSDDWKPYRELAVFEILQGQYSSALDLMLRYPLLQQTPPDRTVELSNQAHDGASLLYWRGAYKEASVLYRKSRAYGTGSDADMASGVALGILDRNYQEAAQLSLQRAQRYDNKHGLRDYMSLLHLLGYGEASWTAFDALLDKPYGPEVWTSAFVGQRIERWSDEKIVSWTIERSRRLNDEFARRIGARHIFMSLVMDRATNPTLPAAIRRLGDMEHPYDSTPARRSYVTNAQLAKFAEAYNLVRAHDYGRAHHIFVQEMLVRTYDSRTLFMLPYYARASVKVGNMRYMNDVLASRDEKKDSRWESDSFYFLIGKAFVAGQKGEHDRARAHLKAAFGRRPRTELNPIDTWYQLVEACEWLYEDFRDKRYRDLAVEWAKQYQVIQPMFAWAYAVEAKYATDKQARQRALALTLYLDSRSERIQHFKEEERRAALELLKRQNPFREMEGGEKSSI